MANIFVRIAAWIAGLWAVLPESVKSKIIDIVVESFEHLFRSYFQKKKSDLKSTPTTEAVANV